MIDWHNFRSKINFLSNIHENDEFLSVEVSFNELPQFTEILASIINSGDWIFLDGDLGCGKTTFSKYLSLALGANEYSTSPTFTMLNIEKLNPLKGINNKSSNIKNLIHLDLYRIKKGTELLYLGIENEFNLNSTVGIFEWPYQVDEDDWENLYKITQCQRPKRIIEIKIDIHDTDINKRIYSFNKMKQI